jgi:hypothetical protein
MKSSTKNAAKSPRDIAYYRRRFQNRVYAQIIKFVNEESQRGQLTKKDVAERLNKDPGQLSRLLGQPSNLTLDTITDLLLAFDAEAEPPEIVKFSDRLKPNSMHPLIARAIHADALNAIPYKTVVVASATNQVPVISKSFAEPKSSGGGQRDLVAAE